MPSTTLPDALADALGRVVADVQRQANKNLELMAAKYEAVAATSEVTVAKMGGRIIELEAEVRGFIARETMRVSTAINGIRNGDPGEPGKSITIDDVRPLVDDLVGKAVAALPKHEDGKSVDPATVRLMVAEEVAKVPAATNGKDADPELIARMVDAAVAKIPPAPSGKDVDPAIVAALVATEVERAVSALPKPENGKSVTIDDVRPVIDDLVGKAVAALPKHEDGADGVGLASAIIGRDGDLILTLTNGSTKSLGVVVGRDADQAALAKQLEEMVAKFPVPKDGKDGLGFEHLEEESEDSGRVILRRYRRGDEIKEFRHITATPVYRGVWKEGAFLIGDTVTREGSLWHCEKPTSAVPGTSSDWKLCAKRGQNGKDGKDGDRGPPGKDGAPGRDLTQMGPNGAKW